MIEKKSLGNNKLVQVLKTLSNDEWKEFEKFVSSPFFNKGRNYLPLLNALYAFRPLFDDPGLTKEFLYSKIFQAREYKESVMKSMMSRLDELAEEFIIQTAFKKNENMIRERYLLKESGIRGLQKIALSTIGKFEKSSNEKKTGILDHLTKRDFYNEVSNYHYIFDEPHKGRNDILSYQKNILYGFLTEFLITEGTIYSQKSFWDEHIKDDFILRIADVLNINTVLEEIRLHDIRNYDVLKLFNLLRLAAKYPETDDHYLELRDEFFRNIHAYEVDLRKFVMHCLGSILTVKGRAGSLKEAHALRRKIYEENLYLFSRQRKMTAGEFRSAFLEAVYLEEFEWAEQFFETYIDLVQSSKRKNLAAFAKAHLLFHKADYDGSLENINKVRINQITFKLDARLLTSQIYFHTASYEVLLSYLDSYAKLLDNSRLQKDDLVQSHSKFVKYLRRIVKLRLRLDDDADAGVLHERIKADRVVLKKWLLECVRELIGR